LYTAASRLTLPLAEGKSQQPFYCRAQHPEGDRYVELTNPGSVVPPTLDVSLHPPSREEFEGPFRNATALCRVVSPRRQPVELRWLKNGAPQEAGVATRGPAADGHGAYVTDSSLAVAAADWDAGAVYTCEVEGEMRNTSKALECG
ncbi:IGHM protein, partial [Nothoprocta ornata]|nr:IGHM protein [Nothoprocta ornata]